MYVDRLVTFAYNIISLSKLVTDMNLCLCIDLHVPLWFSGYVCGYRFLCFNKNKTE